MWGEDTDESCGWASGRRWLMSYGDHSIERRSSAVGRENLYLAVIKTLKFIKFFINIVKGVYLAWNAALNWSRSNFFRFCLLASSSPPFSSALLLWSWIKMKQKGEAKSATLPPGDDSIQKIFKKSKKCRLREITIPGNMHSEEESRHFSNTTICAENSVLWITKIVFISSWNQRGRDEGVLSQNGLRMLWNDAEAFTLLKFLLLLQEKLF